MSSAHAITSPVTLRSYRRLPDDMPSATCDRPHPLHVGNGTALEKAKAKVPEALALQIHGLSTALTKHSAAFAAAMERLPTGWHRNLSAEMADSILDALARLPRAERRHGTTAMLHAALYDLTRAAKAEQLLHARIARHTELQAVNNMPGALRETGGGGSLGARIGLPGAVDAGAGVGAARSVSTATFDDLAVARFDAVTVNVEATATAGLPAGFGASAGVGAQIAWGHGRIDDKMPDHVLALARTSVARRLGGPRVLRALKRVFNPGRDRYAERISRAQDWQSRLPFLLATASGTGAPAFHAPPPAQIEATLTMVSQGASAAATVGPARAGARGSREKIDVNIDLPVRLTDVSAEATRAREMPQIRQALHERLRPVVDRARLRSPALQKVRALWDDRGNLHQLTARREAVALLAVEVHHLEALARLKIDSPRLAKLPLASLARDWCGGPAPVETVMIRMLDTLAWLQAMPSPPNNASHREAWSALQNEVEQLATRIHDSAFPHDRREVHRATHAFAEMLQHIRTWRATLEGSAQWTALGAGVQASVAWQERADSDPLRNGSYRDVTFTLDTTPAIGPLLIQAQQALGESWGGLPVAQIEQVLGTIAPSFPVTARVQCVLRFFRPSFQKEPDFPAQARGTHLQAIRLSAGSTMRMDLQAPVPLLPGVTATFGLQAHHTQMVPQHERFGDGTLTGTLLRYNSLRTRDTDAITTWKEMVSLHGPDLDRLATALSNPESVPALEARYWLQRHPMAADTPGKTAPVELLDALRNPVAKEHDRRYALHALFMALAEATQAAKRASPLIGLPVLPPSPLD